MLRLGVVGGCGGGVVSLGCPGGVGCIIQKGDKTDLVAEIGRFFKQNIYFMAVFCLQWTKISNT